MSLLLLTLPVTVMTNHRDWRASDMSQTGWELIVDGLQDPVWSFKLVNDLSDFKTNELCTVLGRSIIRKLVNPSKHNGIADTTCIIQNTCALPTDYINGFCTTVKITQQLPA
jgi:hypothetical protein